MVLAYSSSTASQSMANMEPSEYFSSTREVSMLSPHLINLFMTNLPYGFLFRLFGFRLEGNCPKIKQNPNPSPTWKIWFGFACFGDPYGTRTHVTAVKGRCLNHLTNGPNKGRRRNRCALSMVAAPGFEPGTLRV